MGLNKKSLGLHNLRTKVRSKFGYEQILRTDRVCAEILTAQKYHDTIKDNLWFKNQSVSPGGWAMDYAAFYTVFRILEHTHPINIVEFGLGQMSKMLHQYGNYFPETNVLTIEHDSKWAEFINNPSAPIDRSMVKFIDLETVTLNGYSTLTYKDVNKELTGKYNLIIIDGPLGQPHYSRPQILEMIPHRLADDWCIIMDDYERQGEQETCDAVKKLLRTHNIPFAEAVYGNIKHHHLLCSANQHFLTSL